MDTPALLITVKSPL